MKGKLKKIIIAIVLLYVIATLVFFGRMIIPDHKRIPIPDHPVEARIDEIIEIAVRSAPDLPRKNLIESEDSAIAYARILWQENYEFYDHWDKNYEIWVKHYKEHGVWLAMFGFGEPILKGPSWIIFQDSDGKVIMYAN
jgi:hypothetical protein